MTTNIHLNTNTIKSGRDDRVREYSSVNLWVISRLFTEDKRQVEACRVIESKRVAAVGLDGKDGIFVRYNRHYYPLHSSAEFSELLEGAKNYLYYFFNRGMDSHSDSIQLTGNAPFIYLDEAEPVYW